MCTECLDEMPHLHEIFYNKFDIKIITLEKKIKTICAKVMMMNMSDNEVNTLMFSAWYLSVLGQRDRF